MPEKIKSPRQLKVSKDIKRAFADIFKHEDLFSNKKQIFINVLDANMSADLKNAKIIIDIFSTNPIDKKQIVKQLNENVPTFRNELAKSIKMKYVPKISFVLDESIEKSIKMQRLIKESKKEFNDKKQ
jgi:ribosome-binding factor A